MAGEALDRSPAAEWNQAIMDLAAAVCRPRDPRCEACPVSRWCTDPSVMVASRRQSSFAGSVRQARAEVLKRLAREGPLGLEELATAGGLDPATVNDAVAALSAEGAILVEYGRLRLP